MSLSKYNEKRNFKVTPEPDGKSARSSGSRTFVIQRHKASRLHYDFRLEVSGVLKSWAIPRGPSLNPTDKRLSVMVEDHPLAYGGFSGVIPEGNYGAGIVEIWDNGTYEPEEMDKVSDKEIERHIDAGMLKFSLKGKKVKGSFALVRIDGRNWLLIKHRDQYATDKVYNSEEHTLKSSPINKALALKEAGAGTQPRKRAAGKSTSNKVASKKAVSKKASLGEAASNKVASKKAVSKKASSGETTSNKAASNKAASSETTLNRAASKKATSKKAASKKSQPKNSVARKAAKKTISPKKATSKTSPAKKTAKKKR